MEPSLSRDAWSGSTKSMWKRNGREGSRLSTIASIRHPSPPRKARSLFESIVEHAEARGDRAVGAAPVGFLYFRPVTEALHGDGRQVAVAQRRVEREQELVPGPEGVRRTPLAVRAELLAQPPVHRRKRRGAADHVDTGQLGPGHLVLSPAGIAHGGFHRRERLLDQRGAGVVDLVDGDHVFVDDELPRVRIERLLLLAALVEQVRSQRAASAL